MMVDDFHWIVNVRLPVSPHSDSLQSQRRLDIVGQGRPYTAEWDRPNLSCIVEVVACDYHLNTRMSTRPLQLSNQYPLRRSRSLPLKDVSGLLPERSVRSQRSP